LFCFSNFELQLNQKNNRSETRKCLVIYYILIKTRDTFNYQINVEAMMIMASFYLAYSIRS